MFWSCTVQVISHRYQAVTLKRGTVVAEYFLRIVCACFLVRCLVSGAFVQYALGASALTFGMSSRHMRC